jgi:hypothetical protein
MESFHEHYMDITTPFLARHGKKDFRYQAVAHNRHLFCLLNQQFIVHARPVHHPQYRVGVEGNADTSFEDVRGLPRARDLLIKPIVLQAPLKNHRHAIVEVSHEVVRIFGNDRESEKLFTIGPDPDIIQAGKRKEYPTPGRM